MRKDGHRTVGSYKVTDHQLTFTLTDVQTTRHRYRGFKDYNTMANTQTNDIEVDPAMVCRRNRELRAL
jgi:hypothetical protein